MPLLYELKLNLKYHVWAIGNKNTHREYLEVLWNGMNFKNPSTENPFKLDVFVVYYAFIIISIKDLDNVI